MGNHDDGYRCVTGTGTPLSDGFNTNALLSQDPGYVGKNSWLIEGKKPKLVSRFDFLHGATTH